MKVIITGVSSFIGYHLARHFSAQSFDVIGTILKVFPFGYDGIELERLSHLYSIPLCPLDITDSEQLEEILKKELDQAGSHLARFQQIKYFAILEKDFSIESGELTPTMKVRRKIVCEKYGHLLESYYKKEKV